MVALAGGLCLDVMFFSFETSGFQWKFLIVRHNTIPLPNKSVYPGYHISCQDDPSSSVSKPENARSMLGNQSTLRAGRCPYVQVKKVCGTNQMFHFQSPIRLGS